MLPKKVGKWKNSSALESVEPTVQSVIPTQMDIFALLFSEKFPKKIVATAHKAIEL